MYSSDELFHRSREGYFCVYLPSWEATWKIEYKNNTRMSAETVDRHESAYIILFLTRYSESINDDKNRRSSHIVPASHSLGLRSADDVTIDRWWRQNNETIAKRSRE